ncbi:MAG: PAS domain S-box protein [Chthoniobacteraceae bacterium]
MVRFVVISLRGILAAVALLWPETGWSQGAGDRPLVVGSEEDYPPFALGRTAATADGFTVDLWKAVAAEKGLKYAIRVRPFRELLDEFKAGKIDVMINLAESEERHDFADFSVPHVIVHGAIFVRKNQQAIQSESDLAGKSIIVLNADLAHDYAVAKGWEKNLVPVPTAADGLKLLASGEHDAMLLSKLVGMQTLGALELKNIAPLQSKAGFSQRFTFAVREGEANLLAAINEGLALTKANGAYDALYEKWFGIFEPREISLRDFIKYLGPVAAMLALLGVFLMVRHRDQRLAGRRLRESEERLRLALSGANQGLYDLNVQTGECHVSPEYALMLGYDPKDFRETNASWVERLHPDERDRVFHIYNEYVEGRRPEYRVEFRQRTKDGRWKWILSLGSLVARSSDGRPLRMLGTHTDISARKEIEETLQKNERLFRTLTSHAPVGILMSDVQGGCTFVNEYWCAIAGMKPGEATGKGWLTAVHPEDRDRVYFAWRVAAGGGKDFALDYRMQSPGGRVTFVHGTGTALHDDRGELTGFIGTITDLTERMRAEADLKQSGEHIRAVMELAPECIKIVSADGRLLEMNPAGLAMLDATSLDQLRERALLDLIAPEDRAAFTGLHQRVLEGGTGRCEFAVVGLKGARRTLETHAVPYRNSRGEIIGSLGITRDITQQKEAAAELERTFSTLQLFINSVPAYISFVDAEERYRLVNRKYEEYFGRPAAEIVGQLVRDMHSPEAYAWIEPHIRTALAGQAVRYESKPKDGDGNSHWFDVRYIPRRGADGSIAGFFALVFDITERKQAEAINAGERAVLELMAVGAPLGDVLQRLAVNYEEIFPGMLCSVLLTEADGKRLRHGVAPGLPEDYWRSLDGMEVGPTAGSCATAAHTMSMVVVADIASDPLWEDAKDLALQHGLRACWSLPIVSSRGGLLGTFAMYYREIHPARPDEIPALQRGAHFASLAIERDQLFRSLQASHTRLDTLVTHLPGMAYRCQNDPHWTMTYVSDGCEALTGYRRTELENNRSITYADLVHPEDRDWLWAKCQKNLDARIPCQNEYRIIDRQGRERWVSERASGVYDSEGRLLVIDGFIQDITAIRQLAAEREQLDRKMLETQKLESLGVLAGGIAHDFNNILTTILGNATLGLQEVPASSSVHESLDQITHAATRAAELCKQMLAFSGKGRFIVRRLDLGQLIRETEQMLQISASKKAVLRFSLQQGLPPVEADATQIQQALMNLVINASEAIGDRGGVITVSTGHAHIDRAVLSGALAAPNTPEGDYVFLEVADDGCGMNTETLARIFDPFFTTKFTGRGLGLAAVLGIARGHRAVLTVRSEPGRGSTFRLQFPVASGPVEPAPPEAAAPGAWKGRGTVLVVDDEETIRNALLLMFRTMGMDAVPAADGEAAVEIFRANPARFALVLLDLTMPGMDGEQTFTELRRQRADIPVLLMSGFSEKEALARFAGRSVTGFIQKPFGLDAVRSAVRTVLAG